MIYAGRWRFHHLQWGIGSISLHALLSVSFLFVFSTKERFTAPMITWVTVLAKEPKDLATIIFQVGGILG